jgi:hypothetical protein
MSKNRVVRKALVLRLVLMLSASFLVAQEEEAPERSGIFVDIGLGLGVYSSDDASAGGFPSNLTIGIDNRIGARIDANFSVFLLAHFNVTTFDSVVDYTEWVFAENDFRMLLVPFIPVAVLFESQTLVGPGIIYYVSPRAPSFYVEGGLGYSGIMSISRQVYVMGGGLFAGTGVEIIPNLGCGIRIVWAPSFFHLRWTQANESYLSVMTFLYIR